MDNLGRGFSNVAVAGGTVYTMGDGDGPSWAHPVVVGGRLYLRYADNLYCFDVNAE
jgi:hypothetical protein